MSFLVSPSAYGYHGECGECVECRLVPVACDILSVPASSTSVECIFSIRGKASRGKEQAG